MILYIGLFIVLALIALLLTRGNNKKHHTRRLNYRSRGSSSNTNYDSGGSCDSGGDCGGDCGGDSGGCD